MSLEAPGATLEPSSPPTIRLADFGPCSERFDRSLGQRSYTFARWTSDCIGTNDPVPRRMQSDHIQFWTEPGALEWHRRLSWTNVPGTSSVA